MRVILRVSASAMQRRIVLSSLKLLVVAKQALLAHGRRERAMALQQRVLGVVIVGRYDRLLMRFDHTDNMFKYARVVHCADVRLQRGAVRSFACDWRRWR